MKEPRKCLSGIKSFRFIKLGLEQPSCSTMNVSSTRHRYRHNNSRGAHASLGRSSTIAQAGNHSFPTRRGTGIGNRLTKQPDEPLEEADLKVLCHQMNRNSTMKEYTGVSVSNLKLMFNSQRRESCPSAISTRVSSISNSFHSKSARNLSQAVQERSKPSTAVAAP